MSETALAQVSTVFALLAWDRRIRHMSHARRLGQAAACVLRGKVLLNIIVSAVVITAIVLADAFIATVAATLIVLGKREIARLPAPSAPPARAAALGTFAVVGASFLAFALSTVQANRLLVYGVVGTPDGFSRTAGRLLGSTPVAPHISPRKRLKLQPARVHQA
jgi:CDP-diglyceride synthetase